MATPATANASNLQAFLLAGQSNMDGADALVAGTGIEDLAEAGLQTEADRMALFCNSKVGDHPVGSPWGDIRGHAGTSFWDPQDEHGRPIYVHGPEVGFARALFAAGERAIAIIKVSGNIPCPPTGRAWPWSKGEKSGSADYYGQWQAFAQNRLAELTAGGHSWEVAGFVWHQGTDDGVNGESTETYAERLTDLIAALRADYQAPNAPFILARSANSPIASPARMAPIRKAQMEVAEGDPLAAWIDVDDQPTVNRHHFTAAAQLTVGQRFAEAYLGCKMRQS